MVKKRKELKIEIVRSCDVLPGQAYPYLPADWDWEIRNVPFDLLLEEEGKAPCYVEVKNVTMRRDLIKTGPAEFPDAVTTRGAKHLVELSDMVKEGHRAVMFYLVQRGDCPSFQIAGDIDPDYEKGLIAAIKAGVEVLCYKCQVTPTQVRVTEPLPMDLPS